MDRQVVEVEAPTIVEVHVVRDGYYYFYSRYENGRPVTFAERISPRQAELMVKSCEKSDDYSTRGFVMFGTGSDIQFSVIGKWIDRGNGVARYV